MSKFIGSLAFSIPNPKAYIRLTTTVEFKNKRRRLLTEFIQSKYKNRPNRIVKIMMDLM